MADIEANQNLALSQRMLQMQSEINRLKNQPNLGLATTRQLLEELKARAEITVEDPTDKLMIRELSKLMLTYSSPEALDYRTWRSCGA